MSAAASLLAACSGDGGEGAVTGGETAEDTAEAVRGGIFIEGYDRDFTKMDTVQSGWADPGYVALYEFPIIRDQDGNIVSALAESVEISGDAKVWTLRIPDGLTFHSGAPCTATEVQANFDVFRDPKQGQNAIFWPPMEIEVGEGNTLVITLEKPFAGLSETLATEYSMIENLKARKEQGDQYGATTADGTGPFTLAEFTPGSQVRVIRWDDYAGSNVPFLENKGVAHLDEVKWVPILEQANRANEIESGGVHAVKNPASQDIDRLKSNGELAVAEWAAIANAFMSPNHTKTELGFDDLRVRQAISHAIDREGIVQSIFFGHATATPGPIASNYTWYEPGVEQFNSFDPEKSKSLLDEAGWRIGSGGIRQRNGKKLTFTHLNWGGQTFGANIMQAIIPMLADVGIEMKVKTLETAAFFPALQEGPESFGFEWLWSSPVDVLIIFNAFPNAEFNGELADVKAAFAAWQSAPDEAALEEAARAAQLAWAEGLPKIPILTRNDVWVHSKRVHGWRPSQTMLYPLYNDVWLEQ